MKVGGGMMDDRKPRGLLLFEPSMYDKSQKLLEDCCLLLNLGLYICIKVIDMRWLNMQALSKEAVSLNKVQFKITCQAQVHHIPRIRVGGDFPCFTEVVV